MISGMHYPGDLFNQLEIKSAIISIYFITFLNLLKSTLRDSFAFFDSLYGLVILEIIFYFYIFVLSFTDVVL